MDQQQQRGSLLQTLLQMRRPLSIAVVSVGSDANAKRNTYDKKFKKSF